MLLLLLLTTLFLLESKLAGLQDELVKRELIRPTMDYSSQVPDAYPIRKALSILHDAGGPAPSRVVLNDPKLSGNDLYQMRKSPRQSLAFVDPRETNGPVHVNAWTEVYERASKQKEDALRHLASILGHEAQHEITGRDENTAYDTQLRILQALRAKPSELQPVIDAKEHVARMKQLDGQ